jgi:hypothetical protein
MTGTTTTKDHSGPLELLPEKSCILAISSTPLVDEDRFHDTRVVSEFAQVSIPSPKSPSFQSIPIFKDQEHVNSQLRPSYIALASKTENPATRPSRRPRTPAQPLALAQ